MSRFYFGDSSSNGSTSDVDDDDETLPYPTPLQRRDFLAPDFSPSEYLSSLRNRHQTLEDLRSELRSRSQLLNKELLDLVNSNYQDFLGLGSSLRSGEEKVEEVRVGLLGFRKEVEAVKRNVAEREEHVKELVDQRVAIRREIAVGRSLLDINSRLTALEHELMMDSAGKPPPSDDTSDDGFETEESTDEDDEGPSSVSVSKIQKHVQQYRVIQQIQKGIGGGHPFIAAQVPRLIKVRNTLLLDLGTALRESQGSEAPKKNRVMRILRLYGDMDESAEAVQLLKSIKSG